VRLEHVLRRRPHRERKPRAARVQIGEDGKRRALHLLEEEHGPPPCLLLELDDERCDLVGRVYLLRDDGELLALLPLDQIQVASEVLSHAGSRHGFLQITFRSAWRFSTWTARSARSRAPGSWAGSSTRSACPPEARQISS